MSRQNSSKKINIDLTEKGSIFAQMNQLSEQKDSEGSPISIEHENLVFGKIDIKDKTILGDF